VYSSDSLMTRLSQMGYAIFHKEVNLMSSGITCAEFSLVKLDIKCPDQYTKLAKALQTSSRSSATSGSTAHLKNKKRSSVSSTDLLPNLDKFRQQVARATITYPANRFIY
jgi:hypothetical protein